MPFTIGTLGRIVRVVFLEHFIGSRNCPVSDLGWGTVPGIAMTAGHGDAFLIWFTKGGLVDPQTN